MGRLRCHLSISLDGFVAGPDPTPGNPLGEGGARLHEWATSLAAWRQAHGHDGGEANASTAVLEETLAGVGAGIMGRAMFGPVGGGPWGDDPWNGWWGDEPPFGCPVFVLTHHARPPLATRNGTFHFVTDGITSALEQAMAAAAGADVMIWGGADVLHQYLAAGLLDELVVHVAPVLLGGGTRLFATGGLPDVRLEQVRVVEAPGVTHLTYRLVH